MKHNEIYKREVAKNNKVIRDFRGEHPKHRIPEYNWDHSMFQERLLRAGVESRFFGLDARDSNLHTLIISQLKAEFCKRRIKAIEIYSSLGKSEEVLYEND